MHVKQHRWHSSPLMLAPWQMLVSALPLTVLALMTEGVPQIIWNAQLIGLLTFIGPIATCFCFVISLAVGRRISSVSMSIATLEGFQLFWAVLFDAVLVRELRSR